jgi:large subunit ribosomal protein L18
MKKKRKTLSWKNRKRYIFSMHGTKEKPRLSVSRSHRHIYAQLIDDKNGNTLVFTSSLKFLSLGKNFSASKEGAFKVGEKLGELAQEKNIQEVIFDRGKRPYMGRIQKVAEGARSSGLIF